MKFEILVLITVVCRCGAQTFSDLARLTGVRTARQQVGVDLGLSSDGEEDILFPKDVSIQPVNPANPTNPESQTDPTIPLDLINDIFGTAPPTSVSTTSAPISPTSTLRTPIFPIIVTTITQPPVTTTRTTVTTSTTKTTTVTTSTTTTTTVTPSITTSTSTLPTPNPTSPSSIPTGSSPSDPPSDSVPASPTTVRTRIVNRPPTGANTGSGGNSISISGNVLPGPKPLSFCRPLTRSECGLLADLNLTSGLLQFIEAGNIETAAINQFMDSRLVYSLFSLPTQTQVSVFPDDIQLSAPVPYRSLLVGRGCQNRAELRGGSATGRIRGESDVLSPGSSMFNREPVFFQGIVRADLDISAKVEANYFKNILISCIHKRKEVNRIRTSVGGSVALGVRMAASNFKLEYVSDVVAEISFDFGLKLQGRLIGLDSGITSINGCSFDGIPRLSVCSELGSLLSQELSQLTREPFSLFSPSLIGRVERLMGATQGDRIKLLIYREKPETQGEPDISGFGRSLPPRPTRVPDENLEPELGIDVPAKLRRRPRFGRLLF